MKKTKAITITGLAICAAIGFASMDVQSDNGKAGKTGAPGEQTCTSCHSSYALNSGGGSISISSTPAFTGGQYVPGQVYAMSVTLARSASTIFGLDVEALTSSNTNAGTFAITAPSQTHITSSGGKSNVVHQFNGGLASATKTFTFNWTAPASGNATFYATGLAGNNNGSDSGDYIYSTSLALTPSTSTAIKESQVVGYQLNVFPNPVYSTINFSYFLNTSSNVVCKLIDVQGKLVKEFINETQCAGNKEFSFQLPESIGKGIYSVSLSVAGKEFIKKIIIK